MPHLHMGDEAIVFDQDWWQAFEFNINHSAGPIHHNPAAADSDGGVEWCTRPEQRGLEYFYLARPSSLI